MLGPSDRDQLLHALTIVIFTMKTLLTEITQACIAAALFGLPFFLYFLEMKP